MNVLMVVEDDADLRVLVRFRFDLDPDFELDGQAADIPTAVTEAAQIPP